MNSLKSKISLSFYFLLSLILFTSCSYYKDPKDFKNSTNAIYNLYNNFNNNEPVENLTFNTETFGNFKNLVEVEKKYLQQRQSENETIDAKILEIENFELDTPESIDQYIKLVDDVILILDKNFIKEKNSNKNLLTDIEKLNCNKKYITKYLENTEERIDFEEENFEKINNKNIEVLEKTKQLIQLYKEKNLDSDKADKLKKELNLLNSEYENLVNEFDKEIKNIMEANKYNY